jgi:hypothetical protein
MQLPKANNVNINGGWRNIPSGGFAIGVTGNSIVFLLFFLYENIF